MGKELIIGQHALHATLERVAEKASHQQWQEAQHNSPATGSASNRFQAVMEAAATNPIGLSIFARRLLYRETHEQAVQKIARLTRIPCSAGASRVRVHSLKSIFGQA